MVEQSNCGSGERRRGDDARGKGMTQNVENEGYGKSEQWFSALFQTPKIELSLIIRAPQ